MSIMLAAGAAMAFSGSAVAQDNNGRQNREQARQNSQGPANANTRGREQSNQNSVLHDGMDHSGHNMQDGQSMRRQNSQGRANANERAQERANQNSAVREGMEARDRNGRRVGQVREVRRSPDGVVIAIVVVLVIQINGSSVVTLPPGSFTIINNIVVINVAVGS